MRRPGLLAGSSFLALIAVLGCASQPPQAAKHQADSSDVGTGTEPAQENSAPPATSEAETVCYDKCAQQLDQAGRLLAQAEALKQASQARSALAKRAGEAFIQAWRLCHLRPPRGPDLSCPGGPEAVVNMTQAFSIAEDKAQLIFAYLIAQDPRWRSEADPSAGAKQRLRELATEVAKAEKPTADDLEAAVYAYLGAGEAKMAHDLLRIYRRRFASEQPDQVALLSSALAAYANDAGQHREALRAVPATSRSSEPEQPRVTILWHSERGRALAELGRASEAQRHFNETLKAWRASGASDPQTILGPQAPDPIPGRERVVDAVGAAEFYQAEQLAQRASQLDPPRYQQAATAEGVQAYLSDSLAPWAAKRQELVRQAATAYREVLAIKPVPPPRWVVRSAKREGDTYAQFAEAFLSTSLPARLAKDEAIREAYERAQRQSIEPVREAADEAYARCVDLAAKLEVDTPAAAECRQVLAE